MIRVVETTRRCTWCDQEFVSSVAYTPIGVFARDTCDEPECLQSVEHARREYQNIYGKYEALDARDQENFRKSIGLTEDHVAKIFDAIENGSYDRVQSARNIDRTYRKGRDLSEYLDAPETDVEKQCELCGNSFTTPFRGDQTWRYCTDYSCKLRRLGIFNLFKKVYDPDFYQSSLQSWIPWRNNRLMYRKFLVNTLGIPKTEVKWLQSSVRDPSSSIERIMNLDSTYRNEIYISESDVFPDRANNAVGDSRESDRAKPVAQLLSWRILYFKLKAPTFEGEYEIFASIAHEVIVRPDGDSIEKCCLWCGQPYEVEYQQQAKEIFCQDSDHCSDLRSEARTLYQDLYGKYEKYTWREKETFRSHLGISNECMKVLSDCVSSYNEPAALVCLKLLDERYRNGRDLSGLLDTLGLKQRKE